MAQPSQPFTTHLLAQLGGQKSAVSHLHFSPDGSILIAAGDETHVWQESEDGNWSFHHHTRGIPLHINEDHSALLLIGRERWLDGIELQDHNGVCLQTTSCSHMHQSYYYGYSPDRRWFVAFDRTGWVSFWDASTLVLEKRMLLLPEPSRSVPVDALRFTPDETFLFLRYGGQIHRCRFDADRLLVSPEGYLFPYPQHHFSAEDYQISPLGNLIAVSNGHASAVELYEHPSLRKIASFPIETGPDWLAFSPDGRYLACVDVECLVSIWHVHTQQLMHTFVSHPGPYMAQSSSTSSIVWSPRGDIIGVAGSLYETGDYSIKLWKVHTRDGHHDAIYGMYTPRERESSEMRRTND